MTATIGGKQPAVDPVVLSGWDVEAVYQVYSRRCFALALRIVGDPHLAEDVVQEVFTVLVRRPDRFDPTRGTLATWLLTLTHHKAVDVVRSRQSKAGVDVGEVPALSLADDRSTPENDACRNEDRAQVRVALRELRAAEREVLLLAYFGGYTQRQVAARLDIPLGTVKSRTLRALRGLHRQLDHLSWSQPTACHQDSG